MKMAESSPNGQKTLWVKKKLLVMSNFSFSHSVFKRLTTDTEKPGLMFGQGLTHDKIFVLSKLKAVADNKLKAVADNKLKVAQ